MIKSLFIILLLTFSFYYARKISNVLIYRSPLMKDILANTEKYETKQIEPIINGDYITPGISGYEVSQLESYYQMRSEGVFDAEKIVYKEVLPNNNLKENSGLIINKANSFKRKVSIIIYNNPEVEKYIINHRINANKLVTQTTFKKKSVFEQVNYDQNFQELENKFEQYNLTNNICVLNNYNKDDCLKLNKFLVEPTYNISDSSLIKSTINSGDIIMIDNSLSLTSFKILLQKIKYQNLTIDYLSNLISEKR